MVQNDEKELELFEEFILSPQGSICKFEKDIAKRAWLARAKLDNQIHKSSKLNLCCEVFVDEKETSNTNYPNWLIQELNGKI